MGSRTNEYLERLLELDLSGEEYRLAIALAREILGYRLTARKLGNATAPRPHRTHGRSFERARAGLIDKGLIAYTAGSDGRGNRSTYVLLLEKTAQTRTYEPPEKTAPTRTKPADVKDRKKPRKRPRPRGDV